MGFVDVLGFEMVTLGLGAIVLADVAAVGLFAYRARGPDGLRTATRSGAVPIGRVGIPATGMGLWGPMAWPLPGSYNILFSDVYLLFGRALVAFAVSVFLNLRTQFAGLFAAVAGASTALYGYSAHTLGLTKAPMSMLLLYLGFGAAGLAAFPATLALDGLMKGPVSLATPRGAPHAGAFARRLRPLGRRGVQAVVPVGAKPTSESATRLEEAGERTVGTEAIRFAIPRYIAVTRIVFVLVVSLAAIATGGFVDSTIPSHLSSAA
jgi:putative membrane protein